MDQLSGITDSLKSIKPIYFKRWHQGSIHKLSNLFDEGKKCFLSFDKFLNQFQIKYNFLQYHGLLSAIPRNGISFLSKNSTQPQSIYQQSINVHVKRFANGQLIIKISRPRLLRKDSQNADLTLLNGRKYILLHSPRQKRLKMNWSWDHSTIFTEPSASQC